MYTGGRAAAAELLTWHGKSIRNENACNQQQ
jgi:hypothetical protein